MAAVIACGPQCSGTLSPLFVGALVGALVGSFVAPTLVGAAVVGLSVGALVVALVGSFVGALPVFHDDIVKLGGGLKVEQLLFCQ